MDAHDTENSAEFTGWAHALSSVLLESRLRFKIRAQGTALALPGLHSGAVAPSGPSSARAPDEFTAGNERFVNFLAEVFTQLACGVTIGGPKSHAEPEVHTEKHYIFGDPGL